MSGQKGVRRERLSTSRRLILLLRGLEKCSGKCDLTRHGLQIFSVGHDVVFGYFDWVPKPCKAPKTLRARTADNVGALVVR